MIEIEPMAPAEASRPDIQVIGVGGGGGNAAARLAAGGMSGVRLVAANTDAQALRAAPALWTLQLGPRATRGLGAGSRPEIGRAAAEESIGAIEGALEGARMCFIAAGLGGGTGTGAAPIIAEAARRKGILTVGVVTRPFDFEGRRRARIAEEGLAELERAADTVIVVPNQNLFRIADLGTTMKEAFGLVDAVLEQGVRSVVDLMLAPGLVNLDFADLRTAMADMGRAAMATAEATGEERARRAAEEATCNPLLEDAIHGARGLVLSIAGGNDLRLGEIEAVADHVRAAIDEEAEIVWGSIFDPALEGVLRVSLIATGIGPASAAAVEVAVAEVQEPAVEPEPRPPAQILLPLPPRPAAVPAPAVEPEAELLLTAQAKEPVAERGPSLVERLASAARDAAVRPLPRAAPAFRWYGSGAR